MSALRPLLPPRPTSQVRRSLLERGRRPPPGQLLPRRSRKGKEGRSSGVLPALPRACVTLGCPPHLSVPISEKSAGKKHLPTHPDPRLLSAAGFSVPRAHESSFQRVDGGALVTARALSHFPSSPFPGSHFPGAQLPGQSHRHSLCAHACACDFGGIDGLGCLASMPVSEQGLWDSGHGCSLGL